MSRRRLRRPLPALLVVAAAAVAITWALAAQAGEDEGPAARPAADGRATDPSADGARAASAEAPAPRAGRPNIVVVLMDDQRWDTLSAMPAVRRDLVAHGVTFENAFAVNPLCCPSRTSILTGRYSHSTGVYGNAPPHGGAASFDDSSTIATWLRRAGYRTAYVGKYLNGYWGDYVPSGWDRWVGYNGGYFNYSVNVDGTTVRHGDRAADYSTDVFAREAVSFIAETRRRFFLVFAPYAPHLPSVPAPRHARAFAGVKPWRPPSYDERDARDKPRWLKSRPPLTGAQERKMDEIRRGQLGTLLAVDEAVRDIVDALRKSGRLDETMIVFTSDNGLTWGEHRLTDRKSNAFEESIRIPLVVRYDRLVRTPRRESRLVTNIDLAPTWADVARVAARGADGRSLVPLLAGRETRWRRSFLIEHLQARKGPQAEVPTYCAVRNRRFKYVAYATREEELYDLARDPYELENRADDPALRERLGALRAELRALCRPAPPGFRTGWIPARRG